jgi:hypothetical protein
VFVGNVTQLITQKICILKKYFLSLSMKINYGITGNYYITSDSKEELIGICQLIQRAVSSIYYNKKYKIWAIRIKDKSTKNLIRSALRPNL